MTPEILRVGIIPNNGIFNVTVKSDGSFDIVNGYEVGLLQMILQGIRTDYEVCLSRDREWGRPLPDGNWTGLIGMIQRNEIDMAVGFLTITQERMKVVSFSYPYKISEILFATKILTLPTYHALIRPFDSVVWITLFAALVSLPLIFLILSPKYQQEKYSSVIFKMFGTLCQKSVSIIAPTIRQKLLFATWLTASLFFSHTYVSVVSSFMTVPIKSNSTVDTVQGLADAVQSGFYACATLRGAHVANDFARSPENSVKILGQYIINNDGYVGVTSEACEQYLSGGNRALILNRQDFGALVRSKVNFSKDYFYAAHIAVATRKNFKHRATLEKLIHKVYASGILQKDKKEYDYRLTGFTNHDEKSKNLQLKDLFQLFILLFAGHLCSVVILLSEIIYNKFKKF